MKNKIIIIISLVVIIGSILFITTIKNSNKLNSSSLLVSSTYYNNAWQEQYSGAAIFSDGSIYSGSFIDDEIEIDKYDLNNKEDLEKYIKKYATIENYRVSKNEIALIKKYLKLVENSNEETSLNCESSDAGSFSVTGWYNNKKIELSLFGDCSFKSDNKYVKKILKICNKHFN